MDVIALLLYTTAAICLALAAANIGGRVNLLPLGLLAWVAVPLLHAADAVS
jgi:hypothetical protein